LEYEDSDPLLRSLDGFTSTIISHGGTISAQSRHTLDAISPFLFERISGRAGFQLMQKIKHSYDPNNVLNKDCLFNYTKLQAMSNLKRK